MTNSTYRAPTLQSIDVCACKDEPIGSGATETFQCNKQGRYVVILLEALDSVLTLCEVEVFTGELQGGIVRHSQPSFNTAITRCSLQAVSAEQKSEMFRCFMKCVDNVCCKAVNITSCQLFYTQPENSEFILV